MVAKTVGMGEEMEKLQCSAIVYLSAVIGILILSTQPMAHRKKEEQ